MSLQITSSRYQQYQLFIMTTVTITFMSFICRYNDYQYRRFLIVIIKRYDFKDETLSSFDSTDGIYQAEEDVVGRETPITKLTT